MTQHHRKESGSALIIAMIVVVMVGGMASAFLTVSLSYSNATARGSVSEMSLHIAEAGIDDAVNKINAYVAWQYAGGVGVVPGNFDFAPIPLVDPAVPGTWITSNINGGSYTVSISPLFTVPTIQYTLVALGTRGTSRRSLEVVIVPTVPNPLFPYGMFGDTTITDSGNVFTDGYNSTLGTYASQAINTDAQGLLFALNSGNIGSNQNITANGSVSIHGNATPGYSDPPGTYSVTANGGIVVTGSTAQATAVVSTTPPSYNPPIATSGNFSLGGNNSGTIGADGVPTTIRYSTLSLTAQAQLTFRGNVVIYVDGDVSQVGQSVINIAPGATVEFRHGSGNFKLAGGGLVNSTTIPASFLLISSTTGSINLTGNSDFYGAIYAPGAVFNPSGGATIYGAVTASSINIVGGATFHYDEDLENLSGAAPVYRAKAWREVAPVNP